MDTPFLVRRIADVLVRLFLRIWGVSIKGLENVPSEGPLIFAANHVSNVDGFLFCIALSPAGRWPRFMGKAELFRLPVAGWFFRQCGHFPVDRSRGDIAALKQAAGILKQGYSLGLFPQGTRNGKDVKAGVAFLAKLGDAPVVPVRLIGTDRWPRPGGLEVRVGPALRFEGDVKAFAQKVMDTIYSL